MTRLVTYGWEAGDSTAPSGESGTIQNVSTDPNSGLKHAEVDAADSTASSHRFNWTLVGYVNNRDYFLRFYFKKSGNPSSAVTICSFGSFAVGSLGELQLQTNGKLKLRRNGSIDVGSESAALDNNYHYLELRIRLGTATNNGQIEGRIDGVQFAVNNATNLGTVSVPDQLRIGVTNSAGGTGGTTLRWDDVAINDNQGVSDNSWPGALVSSEPPTVTTEDATSVGGAVATLNGLVNPHGLPTDYWFEYGTTVAYGSSTPVLEAGDGEEPVEVDALLEELPQSTGYHFRLVAENEIGKTNGSDKTFETGPGPSKDPVATTFAADHETGDISEYGGSSIFGGGAGGTLTVVSTPKGYAGKSLRATTDEADAYARGHLSKAQTGWENGEEVRWGEAIYLPAGFFAAKQGQIDLLRFENFEQDEVTTEYPGALVFHTAGNELRLVRIRKTGGADEQSTLVLGPAIEEERWYWVEVRQVLWHEDGLAVNELWIDGVKIGETSKRNCVRSDLIVSRGRAGIVATNGNQTNEVTAYVDRVRTGPMPLVGPLELPEADALVRAGGEFVSGESLTKVNGEFVSATKVAI